MGTTATVAGVVFSLLAGAAPGAVRVILVGDSTIAPRTGYGDALCKLFRPEVACVNLARGGRSTLSYRAEGSWDRVLALLRDPKDYGATHVLVQFGHNDQPGKPGRSTDLASEFPVNVARYAEDVKAAGGKIVLVTPLTRRKFRDGTLDNDLRPWAEATRRVAQAQAVPVLDLNADSAAAVARMGPEQADTLAMSPEFDHTHLGPRGAALFARMVADEIAAGVPELSPHLARSDRPRLSAAQAAQYAYREVLKPWDPLGEPLAGEAAPKADYVVDSSTRGDGKRSFETVQGAVNAALAAGGKERVHILVRPGTYRELVYVPEAPFAITLHGGGSDASATRITANLDAAMPGARYAELFGAPFASVDPAIAAMHAAIRTRASVGTSGTAVAWIRNTGFQAKNLTFENAFNRERTEAAPPSQAVAVMVDDADRVHFENVRFLGLQDTLYLRATTPARAGRVFLHKALIEGDVDFIFGEATAYFLRSEVRTRGTRAYSYATAPSTHYTTRFGFVFDDCDFTHDGTPNALAGAYKLGRQWFRGQRCTPYGTEAGTPGYRCELGESDAYVAPVGTVSRSALESVGKVAILRSRIGAHIDALKPWSDWNVQGTRHYRPAQFDSDDYWDRLSAAGIDPARSMGYAARKAPVEPFLAEYVDPDPPQAASSR